MNMHMSLNIKLLKFNMQPNLVYIYIGQSKGRNDYLPLNPLQRTK